MSTRQDRSGSKPVYEKPRIEKVVLAPDEVLLTGCKALPVGGNTKKNGKCLGNGLCLVLGS